MERRKTGYSLLRATGVRPVVSRVTGGVLSELRQPLWKRTIDIAGAIVGIIVLSPVVLFAGIAIRLVSPGPPFFGQQRVGYQGKRFTIWKLRTMHADVDDSKHQQYVENLAKTDGL
jgi:lipopolysaccharide/colanic/teichoic acid biosynthesis glycosyltransferase